MNFKTIDWEAEAQRVARAFGVEGECVFLRHDDEPNDFVNLRSPYKKASSQLPTVFGHTLEHFAQGETLYFYLQSETGFAGLDLKEGHVVMATCDSELAEPFAKALYYLDLLTPEVEASLGLTVSCHEKLEWTIEYEARYGLAISGHG